MPIIEVNHVTKEYKLGQLHSLKTTALNQWRRLTGQPVEERAPFKALDDVVIGAALTAETKNWCLTPLNR